MIASERMNEWYGKDAVDVFFFPIESCMFPSYQLPIEQPLGMMQVVQNGAGKYFLSKCFRSE